MSAEAAVKRINWLVLCCGVAMALAGMTALTSQTKGSVKCTVTYRERMVLPPDAVLEGMLEDVTKVDAPAETIATARLEKPGNPPFTFEIPFDPAKIDETHRYIVRARVLVGGTQLFASQAYPVLTQKNGTEVQILLRRTAPPRAGTPQLPDEDGPGPVTLEKTWWKLTQVGNTPVVTAQGQEEPHLILDPKGMHVTGSGGCNRMTGRYELNGERLTFGPIAGTLMACPSGMETEKAFHQAIARVQLWKIEGQRLNLLDAAGAVVARFEAKPMK